MGVMGYGKACKNCGSKRMHRECFSGGGRNHMNIDAKTLRLIHQTVEANRAKGVDLYRGLSSDHRKIYLSQDSSRR